MSDCHCCQKEIVKAEGHTWLLRGEKLSPKLFLYCNKLCCNSITLLVQEHTTCFSRSEKVGSRLEHVPLCTCCGV